MIRWRYITTRLLIVVFILLLVRWGLGPVATYVTVRGLQQATGAKVEIQESGVGFFPPRIKYTDLRVADPREGKELKDAFRAETIDLVVDANALLHRRWVAREGKITGIQIGSDRETSGHLANVQSPDDSAERSAGMLGTFLRGATDQLGEHADAVIGGMETVRKSNEIRTRWEREYTQLVDRARGLEKRVREIRDTAARGIDNPLRDWKELDRTLARAEAARSELQVVRETINELPNRLKDDMTALERAKQIDIDKVNQYLPTSLQQGDEFGVDLMSGMVSQQVRKIRSYLDSGRELANYTVLAPEDADRSRGITYDLLGNLRRPGIMVRQCEVSGLLRANGNAYAMTGIVENLTPTPDQLAEPTRAKLQLDGPELVAVEMVRDRRSGADVDLLSLHWPQDEASPMRLGNETDAGISILGGRRELWVELRAQGEQISGRFVSKQTGLKMKLHSDSKYANSPAAVSLGRSLAGVDTLEVDASFSGTWKDLNMRLNSNIGRVFQNAAHEAVAGQIADSKRNLAAKIEETHLRESLALRKWLESRQTEATGLLVSADKSVKELSNKVISEVGDADAYLGTLKSAVSGFLR